MFNRQYTASSATDTGYGLQAETEGWQRISPTGSTFLTPRHRARNGRPTSLASPTRTFTSLRGLFATPLPAGPGWCSRTRSSHHWTRLSRRTTCAPLLERLIASPDLAPAEAVPLEIETGDDVPPPSPDLSDAAAALVIRAAGPVVRVGVSEFEELATALWGRMWPALRRRFSFRLSFGPGDVVESPAPTIVCTPQLANRSLATAPHRRTNGQREAARRCGDRWLGAWGGNPDVREQHRSRARYL